MPRLVIHPRGNLGNQMLQYIYACSLAQSIRGLTIVGHDMPLWHLKGTKSAIDRLPAVSLRLSETDGRGLADLYSQGLLRRASLRNVPLRYETFASPRRFDNIFPLDSSVATVPAPDDLVISVRGAEILGPAHSDYGPVPVDFYRQLVESTGLSPIFIGQLGNDYYSDLLRKTFPRSRFVPSAGPLADFTSLRLASHLVVSVSTFAWLAAWLSEASTVHVPLIGAFNPVQRPDIWMLPMDNERYRFYEFPVRRWTASPEQIESLTAPCVAPLLSANRVRTLYGENEDRRRPIRREALRTLRRRARLAKVVAL